MAIATMPRASDPTWHAQLIECLMSVPEADGVSASTLAHAWRVARDRIALVSDMECLQVGVEFNASEATRWIAERRLIGLPLAAALLVPRFQLDDQARPLAVINDVLVGLGRTGWDAAIWFNSRTALLDDRRPVDLIATEPERVLTAAGHDAAHLTR